MPSTSTRPTAYKDLMVSGAYNAYLNWAWARKTSGEFVLIMDDLCAEYQVAWQSGQPTDVMLPRYLEDLEWLGMRPDRTHVSSTNHEKHLRAAERLRIPEAKLTDGMRLWAPGRKTTYDPTDWDTVPTDGTAEGWVDYETDCWNPWYMTCCIADDIEYGITGWIAGKDQEFYKSWCLWAYETLGHPAPMMRFERVLKRQHATNKVSKSVGGEPTIRALRRRGYQPEAILETLRELTTRSKRDGLECVIIPHGVLTLDEVITLRERNYALEELAEGKFTQRETLEAAGMTEDEITEFQANFKAEAQRRLEAWNAK